MTDKILTGTNVLTDNWLFLVVAGFLSGKNDPNEDWGWIATTEKNTLHGNIKAGVFQLDCIINLLEQIVFTNSISLMEEWIPTWYNLNKNLTSLLEAENGSFIKPINRKNIDIEDERDQILEKLLWNETIKKKFHLGQDEFKRQDFKNGKFLFWSQVINGVSEYLALSHKLNLAYSPHSARSGFLKSTLWDSNESNFRITSGLSHFNNLINKKRIKLTQVLGYGETLSTLTMTIPSSALLCMAESTNSISAIDVALQLRNNTEIKALRQILHEITISINESSNFSSTSIKDVQEKVNLLDSIILKTEKELTSTKKIWKNEVPSRVNLDYFNCKSFKSKGISVSNDKIEHNGIISRLLLTSGTRTDQIISEKLKITSPLIIKQFLSWHKKNFFENVTSSSNINLFNIIMENNYSNYGNAGIVGPDGKIINSNLEQTTNNFDVNTLDLKALSEELSKLLSEMKGQANKSEHFSDCSIIAEAKEASDKGEKSKAIQILKKASKWVLDIATKIGISLTASIIKDSIMK